MDLTRALKMWNIKLTAMPVVIGALETVPNELKKRGYWKSKKESRLLKPQRCYDMFE